MSVGIRHDDLRRRNRAMIIAAVRRSGRPSRTALAAATGLSHSTISAISADLISEGLLRETKSGEPGSSRRGRPRVALSLAPQAATVVAAVLSLNFLSAAVIDYAGEMVAEEHLKLSTLTPDSASLAGECVSVVRRLLMASASAGRLPLRIVLAVQGITDGAARTMLWSPITPHADIGFAEILERELGIPATVENDCNMMALALRWRDPQIYRDDFVAVLLSHGIGMGLVLKGKLFTGSRSSGGEFGHMIHLPAGALCRCGRRGCIEAYAGNYAIWRNAMQKGDDSVPQEDIEAGDMLFLAERARAADGPERAAYRTAGAAIGYGLGSLFALIDPAPVAFVGTGAAAFDLIEADMREAIGRTAGGRHAGQISFTTIPEELPLIREGCAIRGLSFVDEEIFASGSAGTLPRSRREVA